MTTGDRLSIEQERELERLLAKANLHRLRGQTIEAEDTCRQALELNPKDVVIREMLADVLYESGKLDAALTEYKTSLAHAPGKESLEKKFAKVTLDIAEREREKVIAQDMIENPHKYAPRERSATVAFLSALVPGLGQFYNGEVVKAAVICGTFLLFVLSYAFLQPKYPPGINSVSLFLYYTSPAVQMFGLIFLIAYFYSWIDAPIAAGKTTAKKPAAATPPSPPRLDPPAS